MGSEVPSTAEYTLEGVKISLDLLRRVADLVPIPCIRLAAETAIGLIKLGEVCLVFYDSFDLTLTGRTCSRLFSMWTT